MQKLWEAMCAQSYLPFPPVLVAAAIQGQPENLLANDFVLIIGLHLLQRTAIKKPYHIPALFQLLVRAWAYGWHISISWSTKLYKYYFRVYFIMYKEGIVVHESLQVGKSVVKCSTDHVTVHTRDINSLHIWKARGKHLRKVQKLTY